MNVLEVSVVISRKRRSTNLSHVSQYMLVRCLNRLFSPFPRGTCMLFAIEEYIGLDGGPPFLFKSKQNLNMLLFTGKYRTMGMNLQGYRLL